MTSGVTTEPHTRSPGLALTSVTIAGEQKWVGS